MLGIVFYFEEGFSVNVREVLRSIWIIRVFFKGLFKDIFLFIRSIGLGLIINSIIICFFNLNVIVV